MANDWKNALSALRGSLSEPDDNTEPVDDKVQQSEEIIQKTPLHIILDKKGRNGKIATIIEGFSIEENKVAEYARKLKQKLGVGGSVRGGEILIQGDHKEAAKKFFEGLNFKIK